jgi:hypothetical protein
LPVSADPFFARRFGLCCSREGCRRRVLPPSVRFLGRKVYAGVALVVACLTQAVERHWQEARRIARWLRWWREIFAAHAIFLALRGQLRGGVDPSALPGSLWERLDGAAPRERWLRFLSLVAGVAPPRSQAH